MADESPESVRERVYQEELDKGSEPRVAEGRAKAAEMRAKQGLPTDPQEAAKARREREGGPAPAATPEPEPTESAEPAEPDDETPEAEPEKPEEPEKEEAPAAEAPEAEAVAETPEAVAAPAVEVPPTVTVAQEAPARIAAPAAALEELDAAFEPEIGERVAPEDEILVEMAGIKLREGPLPRWVVAALLAVLLWAVMYIIVLSGAEGSGATGCEVAPDRTFICFTDRGPQGE